MSSAQLSSKDCFICAKHRGERSVPGGAIFENDLVFVGHAQIREGEKQAYLGYLIAEPKNHREGLADLLQREAESLGYLVTRLSKALKSTEGAEHVYVFVIGDAVPHVHIHIVPRYPNTPKEFWGIHVDEWPEAPRGGENAIADLCQRLRDWFEMHPAYNQSLNYGNT